MLVKLQPKFIDPEMPLDESIYECRDVHIRQHWIADPDERWKLHADPDALWSPYCGKRGYNLPTDKSEEDHGFKPYGVLLLTLEGPNRFKEIWIENGIAWIMNDQGKTVAKAMPPTHERFRAD